MKISKAYKNTPTNSLPVLLGIPPLSVTLKYEFNRFNYTVLQKSDDALDLPPPDLVDYKIPYSSILPKFKIYSPNQDPNFQADFHIYTDGSKIDDNVGLAVCVLNVKESKSIKTTTKKLNPLNSVFQAELTAISLAADWTIENKVNIHIFTDSLSSILALQSTINKSKYLFEVKEKLIKYTKQIKITWVKAHSGLLGNEIADVIIQGK